jgi:hypothetical protein
MATPPLSLPPHEGDIAGAGPAAQSSTTPDVVEEILHPPPAPAPATQTHTALHYADDWGPVDAQPWVSPCNDAWDIAPRHTSAKAPPQRPPLRPVPVFYSSAVYDQIVGHTSNPWGVVEVSGVVAAADWGPGRQQAADNGAGDYLSPGHLSAVYVGRVRVRGRRWALAPPPPTWAAASPNALAPRVVCIYATPAEEQQLAALDRPDTAS